MLYCVCIDQNSVQYLKNIRLYNIIVHVFFEIKFTSRLPTEK